MSIKFSHLLLSFIKNIKVFQTVLNVNIIVSNVGEIVYQIGMTEQLLQQRRFKWHK